MHFYTFEYLKYYRSAISNNELTIIITVTLLLVYLTSPPAAVNPPTKNTVTWRSVYAFWYGEAPLWKIFWPSWLVISLLVVCVDILVKNRVVSTLFWDFSQLALLAICLRWALAIWPASIYTGRRIWAVAARTIVILTLLEFGHRLYIRTHYARDFFNCQDYFMNFSSCF